MKDNSPHGKKHPLNNLKACSSLHTLLRSKYHEALGLIAAMMAGYAIYESQMIRDADIYQAFIDKQNSKAAGASVVGALY